MSDFDVRGPGTSGPGPAGQQVSDKGDTPPPRGTSPGVGGTQNQVDQGVAPSRPQPASQGPTLEPAPPGSGAALAAVYEQDSASFESVISEIRKDMVTNDEQEWKSNRQSMMAAFKEVEDKLDDQISELKKAAKDTMAAAWFSGIFQIAGGIVGMIGATKSLTSGSMIEEEIPENEQLSDIEPKSLDLDDSGGDGVAGQEIELQPMNQAPAVPDVEPEPEVNQAGQSDDEVDDDQGDDKQKADDKDKDKDPAKKTRKVWQRSDETHRQAVLSRWQSLGTLLSSGGTIGSAQETNAASGHQTQATSDQDAANRAQSQYQDFSSFADQASQAMQGDWQTIQSMLSALNSVKSQISSA